MGEIVDDMIAGLACQDCGMIFWTDAGELYEHGHPVVCWDCWCEYTHEERRHVSKARESTLAPEDRHWVKPNKDSPRQT